MDPDQRLTRKTLESRGGFTLLEIMIALAIMVGAFIGIYGAQSQSVNNSTKTKQLNVAAMLAREKMIEAELAFQGKPFEEAKEEESGQFPEPYQDFRWERKIKEVTFPGVPSGGGEPGESVDQNAELMGKLVTNFLSKAVREVTLTVSWKRGQGDVSQTVTTYWVDLNHEFALSE